MMISCAVLCAASVALMLSCRALGLPPAVGAVAKLVASTAFIGVALGGGALQTTYGRVLLAGLFFAWWGDAFLLSSQRTYFLMGLVSFLLGHVLYTVAFAVRGVDLAWTGAALIALTIAAIPILVWLNPHLGSMRYPVYAYIAVISIMLACAVGGWPRGAGWTIVLGALLFYMSDFCVARERFVSHGMENRLVGLPLYYGGQLLLAWSAAFAARPAA